jgi:hypothetical protein
MAKLKPARGRAKKKAPPGGIPCLILVICGMGLVMLLLYMVLKYAGG